MTLRLITETETFRDVMGNGKKYTVPKFQRDYAWTNEQWEDLWQDIESIDEEEGHYMGYLVLQKKDDQNYTIIDGQQRITTITIIVIAVLNLLKKFIEEGNHSKDNEIRLNTFKGTYIGFTDTVSLATQPKLTLNRNNELFFRSYLCSFIKPPIRKIKFSEKQLSAALTFFIDKINSKKLKTGEELAEFIENIVNKLVFTSIYVDNDINAYKIFETLNARGVQLSAPDLIKNYLFSIIDENKSLHEEQIRTLEETWTDITDQLGVSDFPKFIYTEWNSRNSFIQKNQLFKKIKSEITNREEAFIYLRKLQESSQIFAALQKPEDEFWEREEYKGVISSLKTLDVFNIVQPQGMLIAAYLKFNPKDFIKIAGYIETISVRYNVIGRMQANVQEKLYNNIACGISSGKFNRLKDIKKALKEIYPDDTDFINSFTYKHMKTDHAPKKVRYLLMRLERCLGDVKLDHSELTLEHILPKNPETVWLETFNSDELDESIEMLGNMTLLQNGINKDLSNKPYEQKRKIFKDSNILITKKCAEYEVWNKQAVLSRQKWLAEVAAKCWRIDF